MLRVLLAIVTGLVGAAVLHVIILLAIPHFSNRDAYTRAVAEGKPHLFHLLEETTEKRRWAAAIPSCGWPYAPSILRNSRSG